MGKQLYDLLLKLEGSADRSLQEMGKKNYVNFLLKWRGLLASQKGSQDVFGDLLSINVLR